MASAHRSTPPAALGSDPALAITAVEAIGAGVALLDATGRVLATNHHWSGGPTLRGDSLRPLVTGDDLIAACRRTPVADAAAVHDHIADGVQRVIAGRAPRFELQYELPDDDESARWFLLVATQVPDGGAVVARVETTVHHTMQDVFADLAFHDPLTGLPNRWLVLDRLRMALGRAGRHHIWATVVFADLDRFKIVNDTLGHSAGDEVLTTIGHRFHEAVRGEDTCGRWGGDEFVIVLEVDDPASLPAIVRRLVGAASEPVPVTGEEPVSIGASLGVATVQGRVAADRLVALADDAMYRAKQAGHPVLCTIDEHDEHHFRTLTDLG